VALTWLQKSRCKEKNRTKKVASCFALEADPNKVSSIFVFVKIAELRKKDVVNLFKGSAAKNRQGRVTG